jgi:predicted amidophosphoribosyltransferase
MAGLVTLLGAGVLLGSLWLLLRRRRSAPSPTPKRPVEGVTSRPPPPIPEGATEEAPIAVRSCPVCLTEYGPRNQFCVRDGAELIDGPPSGPFSQGMICPTCRRAYSHDASFCPEDSDELVPYGLYGAASSTRPPPKLDSTKICPECGERHTSAHTFCGRDGAELVVVN